MRITYTQHAEDRMIKRNVSKEEIEYSLRHPIRIRKMYGVYYALAELHRGKIEIVYEKGENYINVITFYWL